MSKPADIWLSLWNDDHYNYSRQIYYEYTGLKGTLHEKCRNAIQLESADVPEEILLKKDDPLRGPLKEAHIIANGVPIVLEYFMIETEQGWQIDGVQPVQQPDVAA